MMTNLFAIANVKQFRTGGSFRILLPFYRTSSSVGVLNSAIFNSFHNRFQFGTILEGLRNFEGGWTPQTPSPIVRHWLQLFEKITDLQGTSSERFANGGHHNVLVPTFLNKFQNAKIPNARNCDAKWILWPLTQES